MVKLTEKDISFLEQLCTLCGPSSYEVNVQRFLAQKFSSMGLLCKGDALGNLYCSVNPGKPFRLAIIAHSDEVGLQVSSITNDGMLRFRKLGGIKPSSLVGHKVVVFSQDHKYEGIVGCNPLQDNETENGYLVRTSDLWIDIGADSREECMKWVQVGDYVTFKNDFTRLGKHKLAAKSFDDRLGLFAIVKIIEEIREKNLDIEVVAFSSVQEEIQLRGAAACHEPFDAAIILDTDFATDIPGESAKNGELSLGEGFGIMLNANSNRVLQRHLLEAIKGTDIKVQQTLGVHVSGGTDAVPMQLKHNTAVVNICLPLRYMHTHYEICDKRDIESAVNAVVQTIDYINQHRIINFVPWME